MGNITLSILYCVITLCDNQHLNIVCEKRLGFPKTKDTITLTIIFTFVITFTLCQFPGFRYPMIALASKNT